MTKRTKVVGEPEVATIVSTRGTAIIMDAKRDKQYIAALTPFACSMCEYPVLPSWKFCPECGAILEWLTIPK